MGDQDPISQQFEARDFFFDKLRTSKFGSKITGFWKGLQEFTDECRRHDEQVQIDLKEYEAEQQAKAQAATGVSIPDFASLSEGERLKAFFAADESTRATMRKVYGPAIQESAPSNSSHDGHIDLDGLNSPNMDSGFYGNDGSLQPYSSGLAANEHDPGTWSEG